MAQAEEMEQVSDDFEEQDQFGSDCMDEDSESEISNCGEDGELEESEEDELTISSKSLNGGAVALLREVDDLRPRGELDEFGVKTGVADEEEVPAEQNVSQVVPQRTVFQKVCDNQECLRPLHEDSCKGGHLITERTRAGRRDWSDYVGMIICSRCYNRITSSGSIQHHTRGRKKVVPADEQSLSDRESDEDSADNDDVGTSALPAVLVRVAATARSGCEAQRCSVQGCMRGMSSRGGPTYHEITADTKAGGQDWSTLVGQTLCKACYRRYSRHGSLISTSASAHRSGPKVPHLRSTKRPRVKAVDDASSSVGGAEGAVTGVMPPPPGEAEGAVPERRNKKAKGYPRDSQSPGHVRPPLLRPSSYLSASEYISTDSDDEDWADGDLEPAAQLQQRPNILNASTMGGTEIDAFEARNARASVLREMGVLLFLSTSLPSGLSDIDYDVILCSGWGIHITCKVPGGAKGSRVKDFVHEFCYLVSMRCWHTHARVRAHARARAHTHTHTHTYCSIVGPRVKAVCPPPQGCVKRRTFVCRRSREFPFFQFRVLLCMCAAVYWLYVSVSLQY